MSDPGDQKRHQRPELDRTKPNRSWSGVFGSTNGAPSGPDRQRELPPRAGGQALSQVVAKSVEVGYKVVDDYLRQGQEAARRMGEGNYGPRALAGDVQELGVRMTQHASDLFAAWMQLIELGVDGNGRSGDRPSRAPAGVPPDQAAAPVVQPTNNPDARLDVRILTERRVDVKVELRGTSTADSLVVHALRSTDPSQPKIDTLEIEKLPDGNLTLRIAIPADHPGGSYEALILDDATNRPVGIVHVVF